MSFFYVENIPFRGTQRRPAQCLPQRERKNVFEFSISAMEDILFHPDDTFSSGWVIDNLSIVTAKSLLAQNRYDELFTNLLYLKMSPEGRARSLNRSSSLSSLSDIGDRDVGVVLKDLMEETHQYFRDLDSPSSINSTGFLNLRMTKRKPYNETSKPPLRLRYLEGPSTFKFICQRYLKLKLLIAIVNDGPLDPITGCLYEPVKHMLDCGIIISQSLVTIDPGNTIPEVRSLLPFFGSIFSEEISSGGQFRTCQGTIVFSTNKERFLSLLSTGKGRSVAFHLTDLPAPQDYRGVICNTVRTYGYGLDLPSLEYELLNHKCSRLAARFDIQNFIRSGSMCSTITTDPDNSNQRDRFGRLNIIPHPITRDTLRDITLLVSLANRDPFALSNDASLARRNLRRIAGSIHANNEQHGLVSKRWCYSSSDYLDSDDFDGEYYVGGLAVSDSVYEDNYFVCEECEETFDRDSELNYCEHTDRSCCSSCYSETHRTCDFCHELYHTSQLEMDESSNDVCQSCREDGEGDWGDDDSEEANEGRIKSYGTRISTEPVLSDFQSKLSKQAGSLNEITFGFELELNFPRDAASEIIDCSESAFGKNAIWKHDRSLTSGAELVTRPYTLESFRDVEFSQFLDKARELGADGFKSGECGFHIHVGRLPLRRLLLDKIVKLVPDKLQTILRVLPELEGRYIPSNIRSAFEGGDQVRIMSNIIMLYNFQSYQSFFNTHSLRSGTERGFSYCSFPPNGAKFDYEYWIYERRRALNTNPDNTFEFRLWRADVNYKQIRERIGITVAFYDYVIESVRRGVLHSVMGTSYGFFQFLQDKKEYRHIWESLVSLYSIETLVDMDRFSNRFKSVNFSSLRREVKSRESVLNWFLSSYDNRQLKLLFARGLAEAGRYKSKREEVARLRAEQKARESREADELERALTQGSWSTSGDIPPDHVNRLAELDEPTSPPPPPLTPEEHAQLSVDPYEPAIDNELF